MKRILSFMLCACMLMSFGVIVSAAEFSDLTSGHWAYANVKKLVDEGTINGYEDGTFKPDKTVTRAEFVKMLGKWNQKYSGTYSDIKEGHWAYDYIMWSGLEGSGDRIYPDVAMKRSDVINLIWKRNGSPTHNAAPSAITSQGTNADATSWAYTVGLMKGDDGLNLRLDSALTRAEAATLIVRSREIIAANKTYNFTDTVGEDILKVTYESLNLLGDSYNADKKLTYGEVARMAIVFAADDAPINFLGNDLLNEKGKVADFFEHKYSNEMFVLSKSVWGYDYYTKSKIDKNATVQDTISAILYGFVRKGTIPTDFGKKDNYYPDCTDVNSTSFENMYLTFANLRGIKLNTNGKIGAKDEITVKQYASLMVQLNESIGLGIGYINGKKSNIKINTYVSSNPANYKDFKYTVKGAPNALYILKKDGVSAKKYYNEINQCAFVYTAYLNEIKSLIKTSTGCSIDATFYPSLSYKQDGNVRFVAKIKLKGYEGTADVISIDEMLKKVIKTPTGKTVAPNGEFFAVFETYGPLMDIYLPYSGAQLKAVY